MSGLAFAFWEGSWRFACQSACHEARRVLQIAPATRIVMVSGYFYRDDVIIQEAISQELISDFISKPFLQAELLRVL